ncbi:MAG: NAD(P)/FAD-dependent oxidoreductase [Pseudomonadota bacterium]
MEKTDIAIIGAGPVGLFTVFQAGQLRMKCHVIDTLPAPGGQCISLYPEKPIYDIPAYPKILAKDLIDQLMEQISPFNPIFHLNQRVEHLSKQDDGFILETSNGAIIHAKAVIIAAGAGAFGPNRPPLENIEKFENKTLFYMVKQREEFRGKKVMIAGGGDSAVDWAISLSEIAEVTIVHRRDKFRCAPNSHDQLLKLAETGKVNIVAPYQLDSLVGDEGNLEKVLLKDFDNNIAEHDVDVLLSFYGLAMDIGPIENWGLDIHRKHLAVDPATMETNITGVFAVGDIASYPGKLKLIMTGFSETAVACHTIHSLVYPDEILHFEHSTTTGVLTTK